MAYRSQPLTKLDAYPRRRWMLLAMLTLVLSVLLVQTANLSLHQHKRYQAQAEDNLISTGRLSAPRGNIYGTNGAVLATNRRVWTLSYKPWGLSDDEARASLKEIQSILETPTDEQIEAILSARPRWKTHRLTNHAEHDDVLPLLERRDNFPGLRIRESYVRQYTHPTELAHLLGYMGKIQAGETDRYSRPRYLPDAEVGRSGLEKSFEADLAGYPGWESIVRDARFSNISEPDVEEPAKPGHDLFLTIDVDLQRKAFDLLAGRTGSAVVMNAHSGALTVCASNPTFDPSSPGQLTVNGQPAGFLNLAVRGQYPPGSTFKVVGALAALEAGVGAEDEIYCGGFYQVGASGRRFHCAHRQGHGSIGMVESIKSSCNVYYYETAENLGAQRYRDMASRLGFGEATGTDLSGEKDGNLLQGSQMTPGERTIFSIGQGKLLATPLQVARAYAALANGGFLPTPHVVERLELDGNIEQRDYPTLDTGLQNRHLALIKSGLFKAANEYGGTAYDADFPSHWEVAGKTGTVERGGDKEDAWFACFFPASDPQHVVVVHVEDASGAGGEIAAPIARDLIAEMLGETNVANAD